jgi:hypothetical protein
MTLPPLLKPDHARYDGVRLIQVHLLRLGYVLVFAFVGQRSWLAILEHQGDWDPYAAAAVSMWASSSLLSLVGVFHPLKMLPLVLFEIGYKLIWLTVVAWPLWTANRLTGVAEGLTYAFLPVVGPMLLVPWGYVCRRYLWSPGDVMKTKTLIKETATALLLVALVFAPGVTSAQTAAPPPNPLMMLPELIKATPGVLGVETAQTSSGKMVIFAWFENKKAALAWYYSQTHQMLMKIGGGSSRPREPMADVPDDGKPILTIASVTLARPEDGIPVTGLPPVSQIAIELYTPLPGGLAAGGRFAPASVNVPGLLFTPHTTLPPAK